MKLKKTIFPIVIVGLFICALPQKMLAQWSIGASYEIRNEKPKNGFGVRLERDILKKIPVVNLGLRAHFSYFSKDNYVGKDKQTYGKIENYDYGIAAVGGVSVGLLTPYVGTGLGSTTTDLSNAGKESNIFWNGFVGAKVSPIPVIKPFVEYRFKSAESFDKLKNSVDTSNGRLIFGISLAF